MLDGDFRSNVHQGSKPENIELTELEKEICYKVDRSIGKLDWCRFNCI